MAALLPSEFPSGQAAAVEANDLLLVQKSGEEFLRSVKQSVLLSGLLGVADYGNGDNGLMRIPAKSPSGDVSELIIQWMYITVVTGGVVQTWNFTIPFPSGVAAVVACKGLDATASDAVIGVEAISTSQYRTKDATPKSAGATRNIQVIALGA